MTPLEHIEAAVAKLEAVKDSPLAGLADMADTVLDDLYAAASALQVPGSPNIAVGALNRSEVCWPSDYIGSPPVLSTAPPRRVPGVDE